VALKIRLNPDERILVGGAVIRNGSTAAVILLENTVPVLREKDILSPERAKTACQQLYLAIQLMYIDPENVQRYHQAYWDVARKIVAAAPSLLGAIDSISGLLLQNEYYKALKAAQKLIRREQELISNVRKK
jgi:flagellar protein FlbT